MWAERAVLRATCLAEAKLLLGRGIVPAPRSPSPARGRVLYGIVERQGGALHPAPALTAFVTPAVTRRALVVASQGGAAERSRCDAQATCCLLAPVRQGGGPRVKAAPFCVVQGVGQGGVPLPKKVECRWSGGCRGCPGAFNNPARACMQCV